VASAFEQLGLAEAPPELPSMMLGATNLTPIDVAQMYNTLANGGFRAPLRAVRAVIGEDGTPLKAPQLEVSEAVSPEAIYALDRMLTEVMNRGTGRVAKNQLPAGLVVAGKTGTADKPKKSGGYYDDKVINTFASVVPTDAPQYVLIVTLDEPVETTGPIPRRTAGWTAVPVAAEIIRRVAPLLGLRPIMEPAATAAGPVGQN
jgi:cell division protein FtsI (penicillin-binding protein 3)